MGNEDERSFFGLNESSNVVDTVFDNNGLFAERSLLTGRDNGFSGSGKTSFLLNLGFGTVFGKKFEGLGG